MLKKIEILLAFFFVLSVAACTSHRKPLNEGNGVNPYHMQGGSGEETYTEGMGGERDGYSENSKCRPGRQAPRCEQHYFFNYDSNEIRQEAVDSMQIQANYLVKHPNVKIRLEGNADDRGSREYNIALGERRARAVLDVLKQFGVSSSQVTVVSFGAEKPAICGDDEKSYQCNRRVDLKYSE